LLRWPFRASVGVSPRSSGGTGGARSGAPSSHYRRLAGPGGGPSDSRLRRLTDRTAAGVASSLRPVSRGGRAHRRRADARPRTLSSVGFPCGGWRAFNHVNHHGTTRTLDVRMEFDSCLTRRWGRNGLSNPWADRPLIRESPSALPSRRSPGARVLRSSVLGDKQARNKGWRFPNGNHCMARARRDCRLPGRIPRQG